MSDYETTTKTVTADDGQVYRVIESYSYGGDPETYVDVTSLPNYVSPDQIESYALSDDTYDFRSVFVGTPVREINNERRAAIQEEIKKIKDLMEPTKLHQPVYRYLTVPHGSILSWEEGKDYQTKSFESTSYSMGVAWGFAYFAPQGREIIFEFHDDTHGGVQSLATAPSEAMILLDEGVQFTVDSIEPLTGNTDKDTLLVKARITGHDDTTQEKPWVSPTNPWTPGMEADAQTTDHIANEKAILQGVQHVTTDAKVKKQLDEMEPHQQRERFGMAIGDTARIVSTPEGDRVAENMYLGVEGKVTNIKDGDEPKVQMEHIRGGRVREGLVLERPMDKLELVEKSQDRISSRDHGFSQSLISEISENPRYISILPQHLKDDIKSLSDYPRLKDQSSDNMSQLIENINYYNERGVDLSDDSPDSIMKLYNFPRASREKPTRGPLPRRGRGTIRY